MSLPATRFALSDVGPAGEQGPHSAARADAQVHRLPQGRQPAHREIRSANVQGVQCRDLQTLSTATAASPNAPPYDRGTRQCSIPSRRTPDFVLAPARSVTATAVSAALQFVARLDRASLEAGSAPGNPQSLLPPRSGRARGRQRLLRSLATPESDSTKTTLHYLSRCV